MKNLSEQDYLITKELYGYEFNESKGLILNNLPVFSKAVCDSQGPFTMIKSWIEKKFDGHSHCIRFQSKTGVSIDVHFLTWPNSVFIRLSLMLDNLSKKKIIWPGEDLYNILVNTSDISNLWTMTGGPAEAGNRQLDKRHSRIWQDSNGYKWPSGCYETIKTSLSFNKAWVIDSGITGNSTDIYCPWLMIENENSNTIFTFAYSGAWQIKISKSSKDGNRTVSAGLLRTSYTLPPGVTTQIPVLYFGNINSGSEMAIKIWRKFIDCFVIPKPPISWIDKWPPVLFNTYAGLKLGINETILMSQVDIASELGIEAFLIDAGWYSNSALKGEEFSKGIGNWGVNLFKFPSGLETICKKIKSKGMGAGLWFAPERVFSGETIIQNHSSWLAKCDGNTVVDKIDGGKLYLLYYGNPQVREYAFQQISKLVESCELDFIEWDFYGKIGPYLDAPERDSEAKDGLAAHIAGVYDVIDRLRIRFPYLWINFYAAGGRRFDLGTFERTWAAFLCDVWAGAKRRRNFYNNSDFMIPSRMKYHFIVKDIETDWATSIRSNFDGFLCFSVDLLGLTQLEKKIMKREIAFYKERVRIALLNWRRIVEIKEKGCLELWKYINDKNGNEIVLTFKNRTSNSAVTIYSKREFHSNKNKSTSRNSYD